MRAFLDSPLLKTSELTRSAEEQKLKEIEARFAAIPVLRLPREERPFVCASIRHILDGAEAVDLRAGEALAHLDISADATELIAMALPGSALERLYLGGNGVASSGVAALSAVLPRTNISTLDLRFNGVGDRGVAALAQVLPDTVVTELDLQGNEITDEGALALATAIGRSKVVVLHMTGNSTTSAGEKAISDGMGAASSSQVIADMDATEISLTSNVLAEEQVIGERSPPSPWLVSFIHVYFLLPTHHPRFSPTQASRRCCPSPRCRASHSRTQT